MHWAAGGNDTGGVGIKDDRGEGVLDVAKMQWAFLQVVSSAG